MISKVKLSQIYKMQSYQNGILIQKRPLFFPSFPILISVILIYPDEMALEFRILV